MTWWDQYYIRSIKYWKIDVFIPNLLSFGLFYCILLYRFLCNNLCLILSGHSVSILVKLCHNKLKNIKLLMNLFELKTPKFKKLSEIRYLFVLLYLTYLVNFILYVLKFNSRNRTKQKTTERCRWRPFGVFLLTWNWNIFHTLF